MKLKTLLGIALIATCTFSFSTSALAKYKDEYKMSVVVGPKLPWGAGALRFAKLVKEKTDGRINIKVYTSSSLMAGKQTNEFLLHRRGVADFTLASPINWSTTLKPLNLFNLPFFFDDYAHLDAVKDGAAGEELKALLKRMGVTFLAWGENGFRALTNSRQAVATPEDMKGMKIRVVGTPIFIDTMTALGANPVNMNWGDAQVAFQQGVVDGQENPVNTIEIPVKIWQYHQYATIWHYVIDPLMFTVNNTTWKSFSEEDQKIILDAAKQAGDVQIAVVRQGLQGDDLSSLELFREKGMTVTVLDEAQRQAFKDKVQPVYDKWVKVVGEKLVEKARADIATVK